MIKDGVITYEIFILYSNNTGLTQCGICSERVPNVLEELWMTKWLELKLQTQGTVELVKESNCCRFLTSMLGEMFEVSGKCYRENHKFGIQ